MISKHWLTHLFAFFILTLLSLYTYYQFIDKDPYKTNIAYIDGQKIELRSLFVGQVDTVWVSEGQQVKKGELLFQLNDDENKIALSDKRAEIKRLELSMAESKVRQRNINNVIAATQASMQLQEDINQTFSVILDKKSQGSLSGLVDDISVFESKAAYEKEKLRIVLAKTEKHKLTSQLELEQLTLEKLTVELKTAQTQLSYLEKRSLLYQITSPANGRISELKTVPGSIVSNKETLASLVDDDSIHISAYYEEGVLYLLNVGDQVTVKIDAYPNREFQGVISHFAALAGAQASEVSPSYSTGYVARLSQRVPIRIEIEKPAHITLPLGVSSTISKNQ